jgi:uncharacterized protein
MATPDDVRHEAHGNRGTFFIQYGADRVAELTYSLAGKDWFVDHTFVDPQHREGGTARLLVDAAVQRARSEKRQIIPACSYVRSVFDETPEYADVRRAPAQDDEEDER